MKRTAKQLIEEKSFITDRKIFEEGARAFDFMSGLANDLETALTSLNPYSRTNLECAKTKLELLELRLYYYTVANEIGRCLTEED